MGFCIETIFDSFLLINMSPIGERNLRGSSLIKKKSDESGVKRRFSV